jgi:amidase
LKPTTGLVSRDGIIPLSTKLDTVGPIARTVKDAASILTVISGRSELDPKTWHIPFTNIPDYAASCNTDEFDKISIGIPRNCIAGLTEVEREEFERAILTLKKAGATIVDANLTAAEEYSRLSSREQKLIMHADFKVSIESYLGTLVTNPEDIHTIEDLIKFHENHPKEDFPNRNVDRFKLAASINTSSSEYRKVESRMGYFSGEGGIEGALKRHKVDVLVVPSIQETILAFSTIAGSPSISVPLGAHPPGTPIEKDSKSDMITLAPGIP